MKRYKHIKRALGNSRTIVYLVMISVFIGAFGAVGSMATSGGNVEAAAAASHISPSDHMLVGNIGHGGTAFGSLLDYDYAQGFRTGSNPNGYELDNLNIVFQNAIIHASGTIIYPRIELYGTDSSGVWQPLVAWITGRGTPKKSGEFTFRYDLPNGFMLLPSTQYYVTVARSGSMSLSLTKYTNDDDDSAEGWRINNSVLVRTNSFIYTPVEIFNERMRLRLNGANPAYIKFTGYVERVGYVSLCKTLPTPYYECRENENGDLDIYMGEHESPGRLMHYYEIVDEDYDVKLEKRWRHWIEEVAPSSNIPGELPIRPFTPYQSGYQPINMFAYDYETKNRYDLVLKLHDVEEDIITSYKTTLFITDRVDNPAWVSWGPIVQAQKDAAGTAGKRDIQMCWDSPWNGGRPPITGYDARYRIVADPQNDWTSLAAVMTTDCLDGDGNSVQLNPDDIDGVETMSYTLTDLEPNTDYEFDVRAYNAQLTGEWAQQQRIFNTGGSTATQTAPPTPEPTPEPTPSPTPLTAEFDSVPANHNGSDAFTLELRFSEHIPDLGYKTVRDHVLQLTNGGVTQAKRMTKGDNQAWSITVRPTASETVTVRLLATTDCADTGAICVGDRKLAGNIAAIIEAQ